MRGIQNFPKLFFKEISEEGHTHTPVYSLNIFDDYITEWKLDMEKLRDSTPHCSNVEVVVVEL